MFLKEHDETNTSLENNRIYQRGIKRSLRRKSKADLLEDDNSFDSTNEQEGSRCSFCRNMDAVDHYCIALSCGIKKLDSRKQAKVKIEIQQLLYNAEFDSN